MTRYLVGNIMTKFSLGFVDKPSAPPPASGDFVSRWKTDNTGTSNDDQITLPLVSGGTYNFVVNWGDGSSDDTITAFDDAAVTHTFIGGAGTFQVTITGTIDGWRFNNGGDKQKIIEISGWGGLKLGDTLGGQFYGCVNLAIPATDTLDTSTMLIFTNMFRDCSSITTFDVSGFVTNLVTNMDHMFRNATGITRLAMDAVGWDIGATTSMVNLCANLTLDTDNYDDILAAWAAQSPVQSGVSCSFGNSVYTIATSQANRDILDNAPNNWTITDGGGI